MNCLIHELIDRSAARAPEHEALVHDGARLSYAALAQLVGRTAGMFRHAGLARGERVAVYLEKRVETVAALFGATAADGAFVPVNPLLKPAQVGFILADCEARILVTSAERLRLLLPALDRCPALKTVFVVDGETARDLPATAAHADVLRWEASLAAAPAAPPAGGIDADMAAILYTSGSTGNPKGVVLSHRNLLAGAASVARYLGNTPDDRILAALPLSFDYGLSQLTSAFHAGATVVLLNYLLPQDIVRAIKAERITGLGGVPPLWIQLARTKLAETTTLRYITNSGGAMQRVTLDALRAALPATRVYLMYGLTEAFRSTFLPPEEIDRRPDSIGKAIPNAEVLVLRPDGSECDAGEPGELVHRGALVSLGYWKDPARTAERFRPLPRRAGLPFDEIAVWSGDTVRRDADGFLYFIGRNDEMIKTSGYRVSPTEVEDVLYAQAEVAEAAAIGVAHPVLGQAIVALVHPKDPAHFDAEAVMAACKRELPAFMTPGRIVVHADALPRNPNGKIDRKRLSLDYQDIFMEAAR